jgi:phosphotriesterase-related protein
VTKRIRTVLGDIAPEEAGRTLTHEHILYANPGNDFDHQAVFDFDVVADEVAGKLRASKAEFGLGTMVDMTPVELGRMPQLLKMVAERCDVNIVAITGFFPEEPGIPYHFRLLSIDEIKAFFVRDITVGMAYGFQQTDIRCGLIKIATGSFSTHPSPVGPSGRRIGKYEERVLRAAGRAQAELGVLINTHTEPRDYQASNVGLEQVTLLEEEGADPAKVLVGHAFVIPNIDQLVEICKTGASLQMDHIGIPWQHEAEGAEVFDQRMAEAMTEVAQLGYLDRLTITYDRFFHRCGPMSEEASGELNEYVDLPYMFSSFVPRLEKLGWTADDLDQLFVHNPARLLAF